VKFRRQWVNLRLSQDINPHRQGQTMDSPEGTEPPDASAPKRPRRRRRGPKTSADSSEKNNSDQNASAQQASGQAGAQKPAGDQKPGKRRGRSKRPSSSRAAAALSKQPRSVDLNKNVEEPLSEQEVAVFREHFRFLRTHRRDLRLKINANEDLLLNGVRPPIHRGVCHHLLGKVERKNVLATTERLEPAKAAAFLTGIIRFSSDIEYVLLFLEKVNQSSSSAEATAALFQGFQRIEFDKVSSAQMRRVLQLITELFDAQERAALLLGLLESSSFRDAFDQSMRDLPEALAHLVVPLRAAQAVVLHGKTNTFDSEPLSDGVKLLLAMESKILLRLSAGARDRLFHFGLQVCSAPHHRLHDRLKMLLRNFPKSDSKSRDRGLSLARHLIAANSDADARQLLQGLIRDRSDSSAPSRWLTWLDAERLGRIALLELPDDQKDVPGQGSRRAGIWLDRMRPVWIQIADASSLASHQAGVEIIKDLCIPGVASLLESGTTQAGQPYFTVSALGKPLDRALREDSGLELAATFRVCQEAVGILNALAAVGVQLPDARWGRFTLDGSGALQLTDLAGATRVEVDAHGGFHFELAQSFCDEVLSQMRRHIVPAAVRSAVTDAKNCAELARGIARGHTT
jgi:hypothetical protein